MNNTTHYELKKPEATDFYNIDDFNDNADLIDTLIYEHGEGAEQESSPAGTDYLQLIGGSDSKLYKALISDIADTVLRKLAVSTSETGLASGSVIEKINSLNGKTTLSTSYISNPHVSSTSFGRVYAYKKGNTLFLNGNIEATWASGFSAFVPIGTINGWSAITDVFGMACSQTDPAYGVTFKISASGEISLFASKQWAGTPFMRFFVCVPCS